MVPEKRKLMVVSGAIAAAFVLPGCAPAGYNAGAAPQATPAANGVETEPNTGGAGAENDAAAEKANEPAGNDQQKAASDSEKREQKAPELTDAEITNKLTAGVVPRMGKTVTDEKGWILYRFEKDKAKPAKSNCEGECAKIWPPALTDGNPELDGVSADNVGTVKRADGTEQITLDGWPVYRYIGDKKPGQWKGQNVGGTWFVVNPDGSKNLTCLPKISKPVAPPEDDSKGADAGEAGGSGYADKSGGSGDSGTDYNY